MKIYAIDWATKKDLAVYDGKKVKSIANTLDEFDKFLEKIGGSAIGVQTKSSKKVVPSSKENKPGGSAKNKLTKSSKKTLPSPHNLIKIKEKKDEIQKSIIF